MPLKTNKEHKSPGDTQKRLRGYNICIPETKRGACRGLSQFVSGKLSSRIIRSCRRGDSRSLIDDGTIMGRLCEQLVMAASDYDAARRDLDEIVEMFITDIKQNLRQYVFYNIKREFTKNPAQLEKIDEDKMEQLRRDLEQPLNEETERIVALLRDFHGWYDLDTVYIDTSSRVWKTVKSVEIVINKILRKYNLSSINMKNWTWLSEDMNRLATKHFPGTKKEYIERKKKYVYLEDRYREEERLGNAVERLEGL